MSGAAAARNNWPNDPAKHFYDIVFPRECGIAAFAYVQLARTMSLKRKLLLAPAAVLLVFVALIVCLSKVLETTEQKLASPDHHYVGEVTRLHASAIDPDPYSVSVRTRYSPVWHAVFGGSDYGAKITISWIDSKTMLIHCAHCVYLKGNFIKPKWDGLTIQCVDPTALDNCTWGGITVER